MSLKNVHSHTEKRILFIHQSAELYGSDRTLEQSIRAYHKAHPNTLISVILPYNGPLTMVIRPLIDELIIQDLFILRKSNLKNCSLFNPITIVQSVRQAIKQLNRADMAYINTAVILDYIIASRFTKVPCLLHVHELPSGFLRQILILLTHFFKGTIVFNSNATATAFNCENPAKSIVIPNGTNNNQFIPITDIHHLRILLIGRFNGWKGQELLVDAISSLSLEEQNSIEVRMLGGVYKDQTFFKDSIIDRIHSLGLSHTIKTFDFVDDPSHFYHWSNCVVVPSTQPEPFGLVAIEAMAHGRAVIGANHGGLAEILQNNETGLKISPGDRDSLANAIRHYINTPKHIQEHGNSGRKIFLERYHEDMYMKKIVSTLDSMQASGNTIA